MKNAFYFTSAALSVLKVFKVLSRLFDHATKLLDKIDKINSKFYDVTVWLTNNRNTHIVQYFEKYLWINIVSFIQFVFIVWVVGNY